MNLKRKSVWLNLGRKGVMVVWRDEEHKHWSTKDLAKSY